MKTKEQKRVEKQEESARKAEAHIHGLLDELRTYLELEPVKREGIRNVRIWLQGRLKDLGASCPKFAEVSSSKRTLDELAAMTARRRASSEKQRDEAKAARQRAQSRVFPPTVEQRLAALEAK